MHEGAFWDPCVALVEGVVGYTIGSFGEKRHCGAFSHAIGPSGACLVMHRARTEVRAGIAESTASNSRKVGTPLNSAAVKQTLNVYKLSYYPHADLMVHRGSDHKHSRGSRGVLAPGNCPAPAQN